MIAFRAMPWLIEQILKEGKLISQIPVAFSFVCVLALALAYLLVRWQSHEKFKEANALISLYKERLSLQSVSVNEHIEPSAKTETTQTFQKKLQTVGCTITSGE